MPQRVLLPLLRNRQKLFHRFVIPLKVVQRPAQMADQGVVPFLRRYLHNGIDNLLELVLFVPRLQLGDQLFIHSRCLRFFVLSK
ncbi:hypothetical protein D1872_301450 [compost metagenome]